jgi:hypothetical protein
MGKSIPHSIVWTNVPTQASAVVARVIHTSEREFWCHNSHQLASEEANTGGTKSEDDDNGGGNVDNGGSKPTA